MGESFRSPVRFPGKAYEAAPHDGFFIFIRLFAMPPIA